MELHGDRAGYDDPAIVTGLGSMDGKSYMFIGHQKGRNTKENIARNFAMPTPHGYVSSIFSLGLLVRTYFEPCLVEHTLQAAIGRLSE